MKRRLALIMTGILCIGLLAGCNQQEPENPVKDPVSSEEEESAPAELPPAPAMEDTILGDMTPLGDSTNLYEVNGDVLKSEGQTSVYRFGNDLLVAYFDYDPETQDADYTVQILSLETGEVLCENRLGSLMYIDIQILDGYVAVNDLGDGQSFLLDDKLNLIGTYAIPGGNFCLSTDGMTVYQFTYDAGVKAIDIATMEEKILFDNVSNAFLCEVCGTDAVFVYTDTNTMRRENAVLDLNSGQMTVVETRYAYGEMDLGADTILGRVDADELFYVLSDGTAENQFTMNWDSMMDVHNDSGHLLVCETIEDGMPSFYAYDGSGDMIASCQAKDMMQMYGLVYAWYEEYNGYVFVLLDQDAAPHLLFWDVTPQDAEPVISFTSVAEATAVPEGEIVSQELYEQAEAIGQKYGVKILLAEQCDTEFVDHRAEQLFSEADIAQALRTIDYVMEQYPEGFFEQLKHNTYREIEIQILGILEKDYSTDEQKFISGAFVTPSYGVKLVMALDARSHDPELDLDYSLAQTMYHEMSHMIDKRLAFDSQHREDAIYSDMKWDELNPEGFSYNESYYGTLDPAYESYFVDDYACSNGTEDRARTLEHAMAWRTDTFMGKEGLMNKLEFYCDSIRDGFDTTGWPEELPWEKTLRQARE